MREKGRRSGACSWAHPRTVQKEGRLGAPRCRSVQRSALWMICSLALLFSLAGCASLPNRVERHLERGEYLEARRLLDDAAAVQRRGDELSQPQQEALDLFGYHIEDHYIAEARAHTGPDGLAKSCESIQAGRRLAPWSGRLRLLEGDCMERLEWLESLAYEWRTPPTNPPDARRAIHDVKRLGSDVQFSQQLLHVERVAKELILDEWVRRWEANGTLRSLGEEARFHLDLELLELGSIKADPCPRAAVRLGLAREELARGELGDLSRIADPLEAGVVCLSSSSKLNHPKSARIRGASFSWVQRWFETDLVQLTEQAAPSFETIRSFERILQRYAGLEKTPLPCAVGSIHLGLAEQRGGSGAAAALALLHLSRAERICPSLPQARLLQAKQTAISSMIAAGPIEIELAIDADPHVYPLAYDMVRTALIIYLRNQSHDLVSWRFHPPGGRSSGAQITLESVDFKFPDLTALERVHSSYYSHSDQVPNPRKAELDELISSQRLTVDVARISMNTAVRTYNYNPTDYNLYSVNRTRNSYNSAVDRYNYLVRLFNSTPSTISIPVYLPYSFVEGRIEYGWELNFSYELGEKKGRAQSRSVDSEFVRIGTRYNDKSSSRRRDISPTFDTSEERTFFYLFEVVADAVTKLGPALGELVQIRHEIGLSDEELQTARWLFFPLGSSEQLATRMGVESWVLDAAEHLELPEIEFKPPPILLASPRERPPTPLTPASAARWYGGLVGEVLVEGRSGESRSSGAIVSGDGLILTCAHGLEGSRLSIRFTTGSWAGTYPAEVVFINESADTALLRAKGLHTERWMEIRLDAPAERGEEIVAIGNPSLPGGSRSLEAVTRGIVSHPESDYYGLPRLVADVAIASGSSGGPLIGLSDGKIVGVAVAVAQPEFDAHRASSKAVSLAAPANRLQEWLGLVLEGKGAKREP